MNKDRLIYLCHKISKENNIPFNSVLTYYFLDLEWALSYILMVQR